MSASGCSRVGYVVSAHEELTDRVALHAAPFIHGRQGGGDPVLVPGAEPLQQQGDAAAAGQAQALVLLGADTILDQFGAFTGVFAGSQPFHQVLFHAAAGDRAYLATVIGDCHDRAHRARRGAQCLNDGAKPWPGFP